MSTTVQGPTAPVRRRDARLPVAAVVAAGWAAMVSYAPVAALAFAGSWGSGTSGSGVARLSAAGWLLAHGVPIETPADRITLMPLALTALAVWRLTRAGVHASRSIGGHRHRTPGKALAAGIAVGMAYAGLGSAVAALARSTDVGLSPWRAAVNLGVVGGVAASAGALAHAGSGRRMFRALPAGVRDALRAGTAAAALVVATGAAVAGAALAFHGGAGAEILGSYQAGVQGQAGITALCLIYLPNLALWAAGYVLGPGFAVGTATIVSPGEVAFGSLPGLPVFAALPTAGLTGVAPLLLGVPLLAGVVAGATVISPARSGREVRTAAALTGPVAGLVLLGLSTASAGALGSGRLAILGPTDWRVGLLAAVVVGLGALAGAALAATPHRKRRSSSETAPAPLPSDGPPTRGVAGRRTVR